MSLPGLELAEASVETHHAPPPPTQVSLRAGSEWRFEIAFGASVRVKVCPTLPGYHRPLFFFVKVGAILY